MLKKTILFIESGTSGYGGSFHSLYQTIRVISSIKYQIIVIFFNETEFYEKLIEKGIECHYIPDYLYHKGKEFQARLLWKLNSLILKYLPALSIPWEYIVHISTIKQIKTLAQNKQVDLIHLNNQLARDFMGLFIAKSLQIPCVVHLRTFNSESINKHKIKYVENLRVRYIAISQRLKQHWSKKGLNEKDIDVIYNVFLPEDRGKVTDAIPQCLIDNHGKNLIFVGRLIECKGLSFLLQSFAQLLDHIHHVRLFIVGNGEEEEALREKSRQLKIQDKLFFLGFHNNPQVLISKVDLLVLPSNKEGFGRVLLEAMHVGTPVIGTQIGGIPEIIEHEVNGLLVPYGNEKALKDAMYRILTSTSFKKRMIEGGMQTLRTRFQAEGYCEKLEHLYDTLLSTPTNSF